MIKKTLIPTNDLYIQFTEEELSSIGAGPGTKFEAKVHDDGSIELRPYAKIEVDIEEWPRIVLEEIIRQSCEQDISVNDVINDLLKKSLKGYPTVESFEKSKELLLEKDYLFKANIDSNSINSDTGICGGSV
jgi:hypothetical protein